MSGQYRSYQISCIYKDLAPEWSEEVVVSGYSWKDAIYNWLNEDWYKGWDQDDVYHVLSEAQSEDGRSGMIEIKEEMGPQPLKLSNIKATLIED